MDLGHWVTAVEIPESLPFGFVYRISNLVTGHYYIGKKQCFRSIRRKPLKGKKRVRKDQVESDWRTYTGSSKKLNEHIEKFGTVAFGFEILEFCGSRWDLTYRELEHQVTQDVLRDELSYNGIINVRLGKKR